MELASGLALGAGAMYFLDRSSGRRRRAHFLNASRHELTIVRRGLMTAAYDLRHRSQGLIARLARVNQSIPSDDILRERVRSRLGRLSGHPRAILVEAQNGRVTLRGAVLAREADHLVAAVRHVPGVMEVDNQLTAHFQPSDDPRLRGPGRHHRRRPRPGFWPPAVRLIAGSGGALLLSSGFRRRGAISPALRVAGACLVSRALSNRTLPQLIGWDSRRGIEVRKSIVIDAPVETVFPFLDSVENLNRFMSHIRQVKDLGDGRSRWELSGLGGWALSWTAVQVQRVENESLAWASVPGGALGSAVWTRFARAPEGGTRLDIQLIYDPPGGMIGHLIAKLLGADPKRALDEDLVRLKSLLEIGKTSVHGNVVIREDVSREAPTIH